MGRLLTLNILFGSQIEWLMVFRGGQDERSLKGLLLNILSGYGMVVNTRGEEWWSTVFRNLARLPSQIGVARSTLSPYLQSFMESVGEMAHAGTTGEFLLISGQKPRRVGRSLGTVLGVDVLRERQQRVNGSREVDGGSVFSWENRDPASDVAFIYQGS